MPVAFKRLLAAVIPAMTAAELSAQEVLWEEVGTSIGDRVGQAVCGLGDVNGDGIEDVAIGEPGVDGAFASEGRVRVCSGVDGQTLWTSHGEGTGDNFGVSVAAAGDVNADGRLDVLIGAEADYVRLHSGADGSLLLDLRVANRAWEFGTTLDGVGDLDGDGIEDFVVGAPLDDRAFSNAGSATAYSGWDGSVLWRRLGTQPEQRYGWRVARAADLNLDGVGDVLISLAAPSSGARVDACSGRDGHTLYQVENGQSSLGFSTHAAGDVDRDGWPDFIAGDPGDRSVGTGSGMAIVFSGRDGSRIFEFFGEASFEAYGECVSAGQDLNADGFPDFLVGAPGLERAGKEVGALVAFSGRTGAMMYRHLGVEENSLWGTSCDLLPDVNGDGAADLIGGAWREGSMGAVRVQAGSELYLETTTPVAREDSPVVLEIKGASPRAIAALYLVGIHGDPILLALDFARLDQSGSRRWVFDAPLGSVGQYTFQAFVSRDPEIPGGARQSNFVALEIVQ